MTCEECQVVAETMEAIGGLEWKNVMAESYGSQPFSLREAYRRMVEECAIQQNQLSLFLLSCHASSVDF